MIVLLSVKVATVLTGIYALGAELVATLGVVEIGPNLLSAITALVGLAVLYVQLRVGSRVRHTQQKVEKVEEAAGTAKAVAEETRERVESLEGNHENP